MFAVVGCELCFSPLHRTDTQIKLHCCEEITRVDKLLKYMDSTTNARGSMGVVMYGDGVARYLTT